MEMSHDCCLSLPYDATGLFAACDFGTSWSYSLTIFRNRVISVPERHGFALRNCPACCGQLVKLLITLEPNAIFSLSFAYLII